MRWDDVNARARGLATHLLDRTALHRLAGSRDWSDLLAQVRALGYPLDVAGGAVSEPPGFDRAVGLVTVARLNLLDRWLADRRMVLAVVLEHEELRAIRALLRGAAQGASPGARLRSVLSTAGLTTRSVERLAHAPTVPDLVRELVRQGHPAGRVLQEVLEQAPIPGLRAMEWSLARLFSERARRTAQPGGPVTRRYLAERVDEENLRTLLLATPESEEAVSGDQYLEGGTRITRSEFVRLRAEQDQERRTEGLRLLFEGTAVGTALAADPVDLAALELRAAADRIAWLRMVARRDPLGPAVVLSVLEGILAEARALRTIAAGVAFGAPPGAIVPLLPEAA